VNLFIYQAHIFVVLVIICLGGTCDVMDYVKYIKIAVDKCWVIKCFIDLGVDGSIKLK
jgi:hypothetical protein